MPRVSEEHLEARRRQILEAARRCFVLNGFHATSMQDVIDAAGLSTGAVYRYFSGKDELITTIAGEGLGQLAAAIEPVLAAEDPPPLDEVLALVLERIERIQAERQLAGLAVQVWAEALRSPVMREWFRDSIRRVRGWFEDLLAIHQARGAIQPGESCRSAAQVLATLVPGFLVQLALLDDVDAEAFRDGLRTLGLGGGVRAWEAPAERAAGAGDLGAAP